MSKKPWQLWFKKDEKWFLYKYYKSEQAATDAINSICEGRTVTPSSCPIDWKNCLWKIRHPSGGDSIFEYADKQTNR
ncbi:MAG: hypothetical protein PVG39_00760 [Desulfobacteraceae bacterium]|jgi:hypothetical protein